ncbi:DUF2948 domain-containing protein [Litorivita pollutaquae]|uniref:DUF2948 domain-containing protein n=1 Tax=Litorivita pollutaquae TaxID=2200892 RepID=A0A2V4MLL3_9RHOB|nr:DUF2948 family protein [Litorivita pollutaquae]PYC46449.1 DUF2948 domain-containing protein [Litorivita pollutaquae]
MSGSDATFEEGREAPLNLGAMDAADLKVISALVQDAVFPATEMTWQPRARRFALLLNRMRWEDQGSARHAPERVQSVLSFENVLSVASQGVSRDDKHLVLSVLTIAFDPGEDGAGHVILTLAGDGAIRLAVESIEATLKDVTRPYVAPSKKTPQHPD